MDTVVVGATRKDFVYEVTDESDQPIPISGTFRLQGISADLPGKTIDVVGTITDAPAGQVTWAGIGGTGYITISDMGAASEATFTFEVKWTDGSSEVDYGAPRFQWKYIKPLI